MSPLLVTYTLAAALGLLSALLFVALAACALAGVAFFRCNKRLAEVLAKQTQKQP